MFRYPHHEKILKVLNLMSTDVLNDSACFFAGGTAISLLTEEYRPSMDIVFFCENLNGYRNLRNVLGNNDLGILVKSVNDLKILRDVRFDRDGIRTIVEMDETPIKLKFINIPNAHFIGEIVKNIPVKVLDKTNLFAEKLMANSDRGLRKTTLYRDMIDLLAMETTWKTDLQESWKIADRIYGNIIGDYQKVQDDMRSHPELLKKVFENMKIDKEWRKILTKILYDKETKKKTNNLSKL